MAYVPKLPPIPIDLLSKTLDGEPYAVIGGFIRIVLWWVEKGDKDRRPEEAKLERLSGLPTSIWQRHGSRISELLIDFYEPFVAHWHRHSRSTDVSAAKARRMNRTLQQRKQIELVENRESALPLTDESQAFSRQPVKASRAKPPVVFDTIIDSHLKVFKPAAFAKPSMKPTLKDQ